MWILGIFFFLLLTATTIWIKRGKNAGFMRGIAYFFAEDEVKEKLLYFYIVFSIVKAVIWILSKLIN